MLAAMRRRMSRGRAAGLTAGLAAGIAVLGSAAVALPAAGAAAPRAAAPRPAAPRAGVGPIPAFVPTTYTGRVLVTLFGGRSAHTAAVRAFLASAGARVAGPQVPQIGLVTVQPPAGVSFATFARRLRAADPSVRYVERERRFTPRLVPNDPALSVPETAVGTPPGTVVEWWPAREDLPRAWDMNSGAGALVGIIDTGIDGGHPELQSKIRQASDFDSNPGEGSATADQLGHGTHVASLACAAAGNGIGLAGAGLNCGLIIERTDLSDSSVAQSLVDATDKGALAINMSFGTDGSQPASQVEVDAINYAYNHNVILAAAAADQAVTEQGDPANVLQPSGTGADITQGKGIDVTSADFADQRSSFAGLGSEISMAAYGSFADSSGPPGIFGAFPSNFTTIETGAPGIPPQLPCTNCRTTFQGDNRYAYLQGTSMATPMVTAVGALMRNLNPWLRASEAIRILKATARRPAGTGWTQDLGWGILDGGAAMDAARQVDHNPPVSRLSAPTRTTSLRIRLTWTASDPAPAGLIASGLDHVEVWRAVDGHAFKRIIAASHATSLIVHASAGHRYAFYTLAVDRAGNREVAPTHTARVRVVRRH
jgi:serine protease